MTIPPGARAGIEQIDLDAGLAGSRQHSLPSRRTQLRDSTTPVPQNQAVVVQLRNDYEEGHCWEARFSRPATRSDAFLFRDSGDSPSNQ